MTSAPSADTRTLASSDTLLQLIAKQRARSDAEESRCFFRVRSSGDSISFALTLAIDEPTVRHAALEDGQPLLWPGAGGPQPSRIGRPPQERSSVGHRPQPSRARAAWPIAWRSGAPRHSRPRSHARAGPQKCGSASAARGPGASWAFSRACCALPLMPVRDVACP